MVLAVELYGFSDVVISRASTHPESTLGVLISVAPSFATISVRSEAPYFFFVSLFRWILGAKIHQQRISQS